MACHYNIEYKVLNANCYDVAQKRERLFIVGVLKKLNKTYKFPEESNYKPVLSDVLNNVPPSIGAEYSEKKKDVLRLVPEGGCWVDLPENIQREYLGNSYNSGGGKRGIAKRLSMSQPSLTLLCSPQQKQTEINKTRKTIIIRTIIIVTSIILLTMPTVVRINSNIIPSISTAIII